MWKLNSRVWRKFTRCVVAGVHASRTTTHKHINNMDCCNFLCQTRDVRIILPRVKRKGIKLCLVIHNLIFKWRYILYYFGNQGSRICWKSLEAENPSHFRSRDNLRSLSSSRLGLSCFIQPKWVAVLCRTA